MRLEKDFCHGASIKALKIPQDQDRLAEVSSPTVEFVLVRERITSFSGIEDIDDDMREILERNIRLALDRIRILAVESARSIDTLYLVIAIVEIADIQAFRSERVRFDLRLRSREFREERRFPHVRQSDDSD